MSHNLRWYLDDAALTVIVTVLLAFSVLCDKLARSDLFGHNHDRIYSQLDTYLGVDVDYAHICHTFLSMSVPHFAPMTYLEVVGYKSAGRSADNLGHMLTVSLVSHNLAGCSFVGLGAEKNHGLAQIRQHSNFDLARRYYCFCSPACLDLLRGQNELV